MYTRYLQSMDRATIHHLHDKSLHRFLHMCWKFYLKHENIFCVLFIYFVFVFFFIEFFERLKLYIFLRTQDERIGWMTYLDTLAPPQA